MKKALIVGEVVGIRNTAMFLFANNISRILNNIGIETSFVCEGDQKNSYIETVNASKYYYSQGVLYKGIIGNISEKVELLFGRNLYKHFLDVVKIEKPDIVFIYGYEAQKKIIRFCNRKHICCVLIQTDWFEKDDRSGKFNKYFYQNLVDSCIRESPKYTDGILTVSDYLADYFQRKNSNVVKIYSIIDNLYLDPIYKQNGDRPIKIIYAGTPGNKDLVYPLIDALEEVNKNEKRFVFNIIGIGSEYLIREYGERDYNGIGVYALGKRAHADTVGLIAESDFSLLLRKEKKYAKAGFATKFAESMMCGVPVIATSVGGADKLIQEGVNGFTVKDNNVQSIVELLEKIDKLHISDINAMKEEAKKTGVSYFSFDANEKKLRDFLELLKNNYDKRWSE